MKRSVSVFVVLAAVLVAEAAPPSLKLPERVVGEPGDFITVKAETSGKTVKWFVCDPGLRLFPTDLLKDTRTAVVIGRTAGSYRLFAVTASGDELSDIVSCTVVISNDPGPDPKPPDPKPPDPKPPDPPLPLKDLRVLMVYESEDLSKIPVGQHDVLYSQEVANYLAARCIKGLDGKTPEYRCYDQHQDVSKDWPIWKELLSRPRQTLPWIVIHGSGKVVYEGPLPNGVAEALALLRRYGG